MALSHTPLRGAAAAKSLRVRWPLDRWSALERRASLLNSAIGPSHSRCLWEFSPVGTLTSGPALAHHSSTAAGSASSATPKGVSIVRTNAEAAAVEER